ncbi:MAG: hypothetical protein ACRER3_11120, partial [Pseudomonas fluorescens]
VKRMLGANNAELKSLAGQSSILTNMLAIDSEEAVGSPYEAYLKLGQGEYELALKLAQPDADLLPRMIRMVAASDGAPSEYVEKAMAMTAEQGVDADSVWATWALALRHGGDESAWRKAVLATDPEEAARMVAFVDAVRANASVQQAEAVLGKVSPGNRGYAYSVAAVLRGKSCPEVWREGAKRLLFDSERPHFI